MIDFKAMQESEKAIYEALKPWTKAEREIGFLGMYKNS